MKKIICFILALAFIVFPASVYAHPGKTDGKGGHYNRSTGEYHYHHGYSAHSHYDIDGDGTIDCPFDFDDKTNHSSGSTSKISSSSSSSQSSSNNYSVSPNRTNGIKAAVKEEKENNFFLIILAMLFGLPILFSLVSSVLEHFNSDSKKRQKWDSEHPDLIRPKCEECKYCRKETMWAGRYPNGYPQRVPSYCNYLKRKIGPDYSCQLAEPPEKLCKHKDAVSPFPSSDTETFFSVYGDYYHSSGNCPYLKSAKRVYYRTGAPADRRPCPMCWTEINGVLYPKNKE